MDSALDVVTDGKTEIRPAVSMIWRGSEVIEEYLCRSLIRPFDCNIQYQNKITPALKKRAGYGKKPEWWQVQDLLVSNPM